MTSNEFIAQEINKIWTEKIIKWKQRLTDFMNIPSPTWRDYITLLQQTEIEMRESIKEALK